MEVTPKIGNINNKLLKKLESYERDIHEIFNEIGEEEAAVKGKIADYWWSRK